MRLFKHQNTAFSNCDYNNLSFTFTLIEIKYSYNPM